MSKSLQSHGLQHTRLLFPSPTLRACSNSYLSSQWCHPTISSSVAPFYSCLCPLIFLPSIFSSIRVFSRGPVLHIRCPKYWSFSFSVNPSDEYSGLISFRIDWLAFLSVHGILKRLLQHHSSKASIPRCSVFFMVQLSHPYMTTRSLSVLVSSGYMSRSGNAGSYGSFISRF